MMEEKQILGLIGSILLFLGVFAPLVSVPLVGNINYFRNGEGDGIFIIALAVISLILTLNRKYNWLWITGFGSLGILYFTYTNFQKTLSELKSQMASELETNLFGGLLDVAIESVQIQWGWGVLIVGAVLLIVASEIKEDKTAN